MPPRGTSLQVGDRETNSAVPVGAESEIGVLISIALLKIASGVPALSRPFRWGRTAARSLTHRQSDGRRPQTGE